MKNSCETIVMQISYTQFNGKIIQCLCEQGKTMLAIDVKDHNRLLAKILQLEERVRAASAEHAAIFSHGNHVPPGLWAWPLSRKKQATLTRYASCLNVLQQRNPFAQGRYSQYRSPPENQLLMPSDCERRTRTTQISFRCKFVKGPAHRTSTQSC